VRVGGCIRTIWGTAGRRRFAGRTVQIGGQRDGYRQILDGVHPGELAATEGAIFLGNMLATASAR
jgi:cobalt-zinc-cadmium efflux system membrane fusion protein